MTYVGKIFVVVIMVFSLIFLSLSTVVFMTERDWKAEVGKQQAKIDETNKELGRLKDTKTTLEQQLIASEKERDTAVDGLNKTITQLKAEIDQRTNEITAQREAVERSMEAARAAQQIAKAKDDETAKTRELKAQADVKINELVTQELQLRDDIYQLKRENEVANRNNEYLKNAVVTLQNVIRSRGLSADPEAYTDLESPPEVDGQIVQVDATSRRMQISIGSDDGVKVGHEFVVYRREPQPEYLGKVRVQSVENDQAVVAVVGQTPQGKKIREGDIVATTIR